MHPRTLLRKAVAAQLLAAATAAGDRVTTTYVDPSRISKLPVLSVYTLSEQVAESAIVTTPRELERDCLLEIVGIVADTEALAADDAMDVLAEQVEAAINADPYLGGTAADCVLTGTEMEIRRADPVIGIITLTYSASYRTQSDAGTVDEFLIAATTTQRDGAPADANRPTDEVDVRSA